MEDREGGVYCDGAILLGADIFLKGGGGFTWRLKFKQNSKDAIA